MRNLSACKIQSCNCEISKQAFVFITIEFIMLVSICLFFFLKFANFQITYIQKLFINLSYFQTRLSIQFLKKNSGVFTEKLFHSVTHVIRNYVHEYLSSTLILRFPRMRSSASAKAAGVTTRWTCTVTHSHRRPFLPF